jgi:hypothetical protein
MWRRCNRPTLPRTRQQTSRYDYDDGYYEVGYPGATRFVDVGNNMVYDRATGLTWIKDESALGAPFDAGMTWQNALNNCQSLSHGGWSTGWRLPNIVELLTLLDFESLVAPCILSPFTAATGYYWSGTQRYPGAAQALLVRFNTQHEVRYQSEAGVFYARPVRGGFYNDNRP